MNKTTLVLYWIARLVASVIMLQTLYFKFTGSAESVYIFSKVGMEPWGRLGIGGLELVASILIVINRTAWLGALLALGLMGGAIVMHLTILGISVMDDGGQLFLYAVIVSLCSAFVLLQNKEKVLRLTKVFNRSRA